MHARSRQIALVLLLAIAGCGGKPAVAPVVPGAPRFADFIYPAGPAALAGQAVWDQHKAAWNALQAGDPKNADRQFSAILKTTPRFYPAEAGLGYAALARKDAQAAVNHFDRALSVAPQYVPALAGKGEALLTLGRSEAALASFEAALAADATLAPIRSRVDVLRFRVAQQTIEGARKAAEAGRLDEARRRYAAAIAASPQSAFLYRELALVDQKSGDATSALAHAEQAIALDAADLRALQLVAEIREAAGDWRKAADAYTALNAIEPSDALAAKIDELRDKAAFEAIPAEFRSLEQSPTVSRGQLAAFLGIRLDDLLRRARPVSASVITDVRGHWAATWIFAVARAGVMEPFANHTFQPNGTVRRGDLASAVSRVLTLIAAEKPRLAARWRDQRPKFSDVGPTHLSYPAAARAVSAGIMTTAEGGAFQLSRPITGAEASDALNKLAALAKR